MGTSCHANIEIMFENETPLEFKSADKLSEALIKFYEDNHEDKNPHFCILDFEKCLGGNSVGFEMSSGRTINLEFQVNTLTDYIKTKGYKIVEYMSSAYMAMDDLSFNYEQYHLDED